MLVLSAQNFTVKWEQAVLPATPLLAFLSFLYRELVEVLLLKSLITTWLPEALHTKLDFSLLIPRIFPNSLHPTGSVWHQHQGHSQTTPEHCIYAACKVLNELSFITDIQYLNMSNPMIFIFRFINSVNIPLDIRKAIMFYQERGGGACRRLAKSVC